MRVLSYLFVLFFIVLLVGCRKGPVPEESNEDVLMESESRPIPIVDYEPIVGGDSDAHGCVASAGYTWCEYTGGCERSWELATEVGFENTATGFYKYCRQ